MVLDTKLTNEPATNRYCKVKSYTSYSFYLKQTADNELPNVVKNFKYRFEANFENLLDSYCAIKYIDIYIHIHA